MAPPGAAVAAPIAASARNAEIRITLLYVVQQCGSYVSNRKKAIGRDPARGWRRACIGLARLILRTNTANQKFYSQCESHKG